MAVVAAVAVMVTVDAVADAVADMDVDVVVVVTVAVTVAVTVVVTVAVMVIKVTKNLIDMVTTSAWEGLMNFTLREIPDSSKFVTLFNRMI